MRWTITQVAEALGTRAGAGLDPWPGWPVCRLILARYVQENCSSPYTDRVTTDTITCRMRLQARSAGGCRGRVASIAVYRMGSIECLPWPILSWAQGFARAVRGAWGGKIAGVTGQRRENHYQRDPGGTAFDEVTGAEIGRKF